MKAKWQYTSNGNWENWESLPVLKLAVFRVSPEGHRNLQGRTWTRADVSGFLSLCKKEFQSKTDAEKWKWCIGNESTHLGGRLCVNSERVIPRKTPSRVFLSPCAVWWCPILFLLLGKTINFLLLLPCLVLPELSWYQVHDGSRSNHNTNDIMTWKLGKGQVPGPSD